MTSANLPSYAGNYELDFERPLIQLERQITQLESHVDAANVDMAQEVRRLRQSHTAMLKKIYGKLSAGHTVQVSRHPGRPQPIDFIGFFVKDFCELHGDRRYADDHAMITGFGRIGPHKCLIVGHRKGRETRDRIACNFGMAHPEGYRKALLKMKLAEKFGLPVVTLVDTPGAYPGVGAEERGQAEAIAVNLREMSRLRVPVISIVCGEGGSGGALGLAVADRLAMMQFAWYSVISPEGCAAILWKTSEAAATAAEALHLTSADNQKLGVIDDVVPEPLGGAHRDPAATAAELEKWITQNLRELKRFKIDNLLKKRFDRLRRFGEFEE